MAGPYDYTIQQPDIAGSLLGGIQAGAQIGAAEAARKKQEEFQTDYQNYIQNPTFKTTADFIAKHPDVAKPFEASWNIRNKGQNDQIFGTGIQALNALDSNRPDVAMKIFDDQITAMENAGEDPKDFKAIRDSIERNPSGAKGIIGLSLASYKPEEFSKIAQTRRDEEKAPAELSLAESKAEKAAVDAKFAESKAVQDLEKSGWEINKLANDINISKLNSQIAAMNAETSRRGNDLKGQSNDLKFQELQLKLQDKIAQRDAKVGEKAAEVTSGRATIDNMLNTADRVLQTPMSVIGSAAGPISSRAPTLSQDTADFEELLNTLSSQAFMAQIPSLKGMGALSNAEGEKLQSSLQNLSLRQSPERLVENVKEAQRLIMKSRENLSKKYGVPDVTPDTPAAQPSPSNIDALLQKYGGAQ